MLFISNMSSSSKKKMTLNIRTTICFFAMKLKKGLPLKESFCLLLLEMHYCQGWFFTFVHCKGQKDFLTLLDLKISL